MLSAGFAGSEIKMLKMLDIAVVVLAALLWRLSHASKS
jgi:hypothetical protein